MNVSVDYPHILSTKFPLSRLLPCSIDSVPVTDYGVVFCLALFVLGYENIHNQSLESSVEKGLKSVSNNCKLFNPTQEVDSINTVR